MFEYIKGQLVELNPSFAIIEANGVAYFINISLQTYSSFTGSSPSNTVKLFVHQIVREDAHLLFGFSEKKERETFRLLLSVNGIGANTARMILSSMSPEEIQNAIISGNVGVLKSIKGIGAKTAERIIIDLRDKFNTTILQSDEIFSTHNNTIKNESLSALTTLGFSKSAAEKILDKILSENKIKTVEELVKESLKRL